jgi:hypothetical protein
VLVSHLQHSVQHAQVQVAGAARAIAAANKANGQGGARTPRARCWARAEDRSEDERARPPA